MYNIKQAPIALKTLTETQGFKDVNGSLDMLWKDIVSSKRIEDNEPLIKELYDSKFKDLDTYPRGMLLDYLATTITTANWWPTNGDNEEDGEKFIDEYIKTMINKYEFGKL